MLVDMGLDPYRVDKAIAGFGMPMGPFRRAPPCAADPLGTCFGLRRHGRRHGCARLLGDRGGGGLRPPLTSLTTTRVACRLSDLVGADVGLHVGKNILDSFPERSYPARIIQARGWLGWAWLAAGRCRCMPVARLLWRSCWGVTASAWGACAA